MPIPTVMTPVFPAMVDRRSASTEGIRNNLLNILL
jgi:hypothetical protein